LASSEPRSEHHGNIWAALKQELWDKRAEIKNERDVWRIGREIFDSFTLVFIQSLYHSLPNRIEKVVQAKGHRIIT